MGADKGLCNWSLKRGIRGSSEKREGYERAWTVVWNESRMQSRKHDEAGDEQREDR